MRSRSHARWRVGVTRSAALGRRGVVPGRSTTRSSARRSVPAVPAPSVKRSDAVLRPDSGRVVGRPHVPGDDPSAGGVPRLTLVVERILALTADEVRHELEDVHRRFAGRHRDLDTMLLRNAARVDHLLDGTDDDCRRLVGAYLTQEHAFESAALTNPSMVPAPDQSGVAPGSRRFLLSLRAIGEGQRQGRAIQRGGSPGTSRPHRARSRRRSRRHAPRRSRA